MKNLKLKLQLAKLYLQMDFSKLLSLKLWITILANLVIALVAYVGEISPDLAAKLVAVVSGGYLASQGLADFGKETLGNFKARLFSRKLWIALGSSALTALLVQLGADPVLVAKVVTALVGTWLGSQGLADFGKEAKA